MPIFRGPGPSAEGSWGRRLRTTQPLTASRSATTSGHSLRELRAVPVDTGLQAGGHSSFRGCHPSVYSDEVHQAVAVLGDRVDADTCLRIWGDAVSTRWSNDPMWFHGDMATGNLLVRDGRLAAVIDFGVCGVGDPACDLVLAWTFFRGEERDAFAAATDLDVDTWQRARGWALWKALVAVADARPLAYLRSAARHARRVDIAWVTSKIDRRTLPPASPPRLTPV